MPKEIYVLSLRSYILEQKRLQRDYFFKKMTNSVFLQIDKTPLHGIILFYATDRALPL